MLKAMNEVVFVSVYLKRGSIKVASRNPSCYLSRRQHLMDLHLFTQTRFSWKPKWGPPDHTRRKDAQVFFTLFIISSCCVGGGATMLMSSQYSPWANYSLTLIA